MTRLVTQSRFWAFAVFWAAIYGWYSRDVLNPPVPPHTGHTWARYTWPNDPETWFLVIANFLGNMAGWVALHYIVFNKLNGKISELSNVKQVDAVDFAIAVIALLGIMGYLPSVLTKITRVG
jgi:hypothetical protein